MRLFMSYLFLVATLCLPLNANWADVAHLKRGAQLPPVDATESLHFVFVPTDLGNDVSWDVFVERPNGSAILARGVPFVSPNRPEALLIIPNAKKGRYLITFVVREGGPSCLGECQITNPHNGLTEVVAPTKQLSAGDRETLEYYYQ